MGPENKASDCGSSQCLIDGLKETVRQQHEDSQAFMKELLQATSTAIIREIDAIRKNIKDNGDELFNRMRIVENRLTSIETRIGPAEITDRIAAEVIKNPDVVWLSSFRQRLNAVMVIVTAAALVSLAGSYYSLIKKDVVRTSITETVTTSAQKVMK